MKAPITTAQAMSHPDVVLTINTLGKMADELRAENEKLREALRFYGNPTVYEADGVGRHMDITFVASAALGETKS